MPLEKYHLLQWVSICALSATNMFSCKAPCMSGLTLLAKERSKRGRQFLLFHSMAFVFCFLAGEGGSVELEAIYHGRRRNWQPCLQPHWNGCCKWQEQSQWSSYMTQGHVSPWGQFCSCKALLTFLFWVSYHLCWDHGQASAELCGTVYRLCMTLTLVKKGISFFLHFLTLSLCFLVTEPKAMWNTCLIFLSLLENTCF